VDRCRGCDHRLAGEAHAQAFQRHEQFLRADLGRHVNGRGAYIDMRLLLENSAQPRHGQVAGPGSCYLNGENANIRVWIAHKHVEHQCSIAPQMLQGLDGTSTQTGVIAADERSKQLGHQRSADIDETAEQSVTDPRVRLA
jgi:hypothetical protein